MSYLQQLGQMLAGNRQPAGPNNSGASIKTGTVSGNYVLVDGSWMRAIWGGDFDVADGMVAECVVEGNKCVVMTVHD